MSVILSERGLFWDGARDLASSMFAPDDAVYGLLEIDEDGSIRLELDGLLDGPGSIDFKGETPSTPRNIAGKIKNDASAVLLLDCYSSGQTYSSHNISHEKFVCLYCLAAKCEVESLKKHWRSATSVKGYFPAYVTVFDNNVIQYERNDDGISVSYRFDRERSIETDDCTVIIDGDVNIPFGSERSLHELNVKCIPTIEVRFPKVIDARTAVIECLRMLDFISIISNVMADAEWPKLKSLDSNADVVLYYFRGAPRTETVETNNCWLTFRSVDKDLPKIIKAWYARRSTIGAGFFSYLATRRSSGLYVEHRFMSLMWGLEAFHRAITPAADNKKIKEKIDRILDAVDIKDQRWLASRLRGPVEPSLDARLIALFRKLPLPISSEDLRLFAQDCRNIRNSIAHYGVIARGEEPINYQKVSDYIRALSALYHARILIEIGVEPDRITEIFTQSIRGAMLRKTLATAGIVIESSSVKQ